MAVWAHTHLGQNFGFYNKGPVYMYLIKKWKNQKKSEVILNNHKYP